MKKWICLTITILACFSNSLVFAEQYDLSKDEQQFLIAILSQAQIRGADAPMLLQVANKLQRPIQKEQPIETPKADVKVK